MGKARLSELLDRVDRAIVYLEGQGFDENRVTARTRCGLGATAFIVFVIFIMSDLHDQAKAPLFALVAATALCVSISPVGEKRSGRPILRFLVSLLSAAASLMAAFAWLASVEQPIPLFIWVLAAVLMVVAIGAIAVLPEQALGKGKDKPS